MSVQQWCVQCTGCTDCNTGVTGITSSSVLKCKARVRVPLLTEIERWGAAGWDRRSGLGTIWTPPHQISTTPHQSRGSKIITTGVELQQVDCVSIMFPTERTAPAQCGWEIWMQAVGGGGVTATCWDHLWPAPAASQQPSYNYYNWLYTITTFWRSGKLWSKSLLSTHWDNTNTGESQNTCYSLLAVSVKVSWYHRNSPVSSLRNEITQHGDKRRGGVRNTARLQSSVPCL